MLLSRFRDKSGRVECHFCCSHFSLRDAKAPQHRDLEIIDGTWATWKCKRCDSWNLRDPATGEFVEDAQVFADTRFNEPTRRPSHWTTISTTSPFCKDCLISQQLRIQLLAAYIPRDVDAATETALLERLPGYLLSLDARYPLVCDGCRNTVQETLQQNTWRAKARMVGGWLRHSSAKRSSQAVTPPETTIHAWQIKGALWHLTYCMAIIASVYLTPMTGAIPLYATPKSALDIAWPPTAFPALAIVSVLWSFWDPTFRERRRTQCRQHGRNRWLFLQGSLFMLRLYLAIGVVKQRSTPTWLLHVSFTGHFFALLLRNQITFVTGPRRANLRTHSLRSSPILPSQLQNEPAQDMSLRSNRDANRSHGYCNASQFGITSTLSNPKQSHHTPSVTVNEIGGPYMDWQASAADLDDKMDVDEFAPISNLQQYSDVSVDTARRVAFRPAVFDPPQDSWSTGSANPAKGLERLFEQGVRLRDVQDEIMEDVIGSGRTRIALRSMLAIVFAPGIVAIVAYYAAKYTEIM